MTLSNIHEAVFKAVDDDEHIVMAEVYAPYLPDSDGDIMDADTIKKMAHDFLKSQKLNQIDVQHDNNLNPGASVVESFIARKGDPIFIEGAWVVGVHIPDEETWSKIKKGEINGFSIEALVTKTPMQLEMDIPPVVNGKTTKSEDHEHEFFVTFDTDGKFLGGRTSIEKGHFHNIRAGTMTEVEKDHSHKFSFVESAFQNPMAVPEGLIAKESTETSQAVITADVAQDTVEKDDSTEKFIKSLNPELVEKGGVGSGQYNHKQIYHEYGAKVRGLGSPSQHFNHYLGDAEGNLKKVTPTQFHASDLEDKTSDSTKAAHIQHLASKIPQFNKKVEFNSWSKASPRSYEESVAKLKEHGVTKEELVQQDLVEEPALLDEPWIIFNETTGSLHSVHSTVIKAMDKIVELNNSTSLYGAISKTEWDKSQASTS